MAVSIKMPDLGTTVDQVKLVNWLVKEGDSIKRGDPLAQIETDKATSDLESVAEGVVLKLVAAPGSMVNKGETMAIIGRAGETVTPQSPDSSGAQTPSQPFGSPGVPAPPSVPVSPPSKGPAVSLIIRNLAAKLGVDLAQVQGTGLHGIITREDVQRTAAADVGRARPRASETLPSAQAAVARAVSRSHREIVPLRITARIDMTAAKKFHAESAATGSKISYDALFLKVLAAAIREIPLVAARLEVDQIIFPEGIHLALAIGLDNELFLPVVHNVGQKSLAALESEIQEVVGQVKNHTLKYGRMTGGCMAISNLGMYPIETFEAIIFPEHSAILAIGAIQNCPVAVETRIEVRPMATVNLTVDHRLINGRLAARFLTRVKQSMEAGTFA